MSQVIVVGGGAAGMMAAYACAASGHQVILLEKNEKLGKKIYITGKGRCNVTNAADREQFFQNIVSNGKFLYSSIYRFDNQAMMDFLETYGCPVKTERGGRVFPVSDHASDVTGALQRALREMYVEVRLKTEVDGLVLRDDRPKTEGKLRGAGPEAEGKLREGGSEAEGKLRGGGPEAEGKLREDRPTAGKQTIAGRRVEGVRLKNGKKLEADAVILACGGCSYPSTGSDGAGFLIAAQAGHSVTACSPALVPFEVEEDWCRRLQGLSLKNVEIRLLLEENGAKPDLGVGVNPGETRSAGSRRIYKGFGEMLFTHFGVSGPLILSASSYYSREKSKTSPADGGESRTGKCSPGMRATLLINLKPAMDGEMLDKRLLRDFEENSHKAFKNALGGLFPAKLIPVMVELSGIDGEKKVYDVTGKERRAFVRLIQNLPLTVTGTRGFEEAIITQGGVAVSEVNPSTMESKLCEGLYFAGEMLDVDALTGGYNLQLAWSMGHLAGESVRF